MTPSQRAALTRETWAFVRAQPHAFTRQLERALVARLPALPLLLPDADGAAAAHRIVHVLDVAVGSAERLHAVAEHARATRAPGVARQAGDELVGAALLAALESTIGAAFTPRMREAWRATWADVVDALWAGRAVGARSAAA